MTGKTYTREDVASWVTAYTSDLVRWAMHKVSDHQKAEDLVQDTFLVAVVKVDSFEGKSHPRTWLYGILNNKIAEHYRAQIRHSKVRSEDPLVLENMFDEKEHWKAEMMPSAWDEGEAHLLDDPDFQDVFDICFGDLKPVWQACLSLRFLDNRPAEEICQELGVSVTNYWQMIHRAKLRMRSCLEKNWT